MSNSHFPAVHIVPIIARIVLCAAFLPMGYQKLFDRSPIEPAQLARLEAIGWGWKPAMADGNAPSATDAGAKTATDAEAARATGTAESEAPTAGDKSIGDKPAPTEARTVRRCEMLTFTIADAGLPAPRITAWLVAIIEFLGGGLLLLGLFSRLSALGIAAVMAGAIHTTSLAAVQANPFIFGMELPDYKTLFLQVSLLALALGVVLAGPGGLSLDRAIFGRGGPRRSAPRGGGGGHGS